MSSDKHKGNIVQTGAKSPARTGQDTSLGTEKRVTLPSGIGKLKPEKTILTTKEIHITAPSRFCFRILARQLEQPPQWDPVIIDARPISSVKSKIGATSQVTLNLGGKKLVSPAVICRYQSNRAISWVLNNKHRVREDWSLKPKGAGTLVHLRLAREVPGWVIVRFLYKFTRWKRVEQDLEKTMTFLKKYVENSHRN
jgi:uncharacterized membrane protein